jgi:hypothetical protein
MAAEAVIIELLGNKGDPMRYTIADATNVAKGAILHLSDPRTAIAAGGAGGVIAGIAAHEKVSGDGSTSITVYTNGIFDLTCAAGGTATLGSYVRSAAADNTITVCTTLDQETGKAIGRALETGSNNEVVAVRVLL